MPTFNLFFSKKKKPRNLISLPTNLENLSLPITLTRETVNEEETLSFKKRSQLIEYEDESYASLRREEQAPLVLTDGDNKVFNGRLVNTNNYYVSNSGSIFENSNANGSNNTNVNGLNNNFAKNLNGNLSNNHFIFINTGTSFKVIPIDKWYKFCQKSQTIACSLEEAEKKIKISNPESKVNEDDAYLKKDEIDFVEQFDDDDGIDYVETDVQETKKLSKAGRQIHELIRKVGEREGREVKYKKAREQKKEAEPEKSVNKESASSEYETKSDGNTILTFEYLEKELDSPLTIKSLLAKVKGRFKLDEQAKTLIKRFVKERCELNVLSDNTKVFSLKK
ncbi:hypothetical protein EQH57_0912 [Dictyocoela roeselum]|nr:hypothetical protein EQH57_0912 [Dictyocoela roeselum]